MGLLSWILLGLVAGTVARLLTPDPRPMGCLLTMIVGIVGAAIGGWIGTMLGMGTVQGLDLRSLALAVLGSVVFLLGLQALNRSRL